MQSMLSLFHLLALAVLLGHVSMCVWIYNRLHASGFPSRGAAAREMGYWLYTGDAWPVGIPWCDSGPIGSASARAVPTRS